MAPGVTDSSSAAAVMRPSRAAASKARKALRGGKWRFISYVILNHIYSTYKSFLKK
jgi:hypothetical protein